MNGPVHAEINEAVWVPAGVVQLGGELQVPADACGMVLFAHGSGSSRFSPRNRFVAEVLRQQHMATLLFDLLTHREEAFDRTNGKLRFDIELLAGRLVAATDWIGQQRAVADLPVGYFGASTGGGAALVAAARRPDRIGAVVSRGGRPDLAQDALPEVRAPTLLIVGGADSEVIRLNEQALRLLRAHKQLAIVPGASHLFEGPGQLDEVARLAAEWFVRYLAGPKPGPAARGYSSW
jgi:pimeloyl-ACP methyl ester carboxylesterase